MPLPSVEMLLDIGISLSKEKDSNKIFEKILDAAMDIARCDGGTLYVLRDNMLHFKIMITKSTGFRRGMAGEAVDLPPVPLSGSNDCVRAATGKKTINVADVYASEENDYSGTKRYDALNKYKTTSMLTVPMEDDRGDVIGVLQLVNAMDDSGRIIPFAREYEQIVFSLASQAAICLTTRNYAAEVTELLDSFVRVMSAAIDARSPYNANHTRNMAKYARKFVEWLNGRAPAQNGGLAFDDARARRFYMSVWLHDIGKLVVPLEVMDKESRLGPKLKDISYRFRILEMQNEIDRLKHSIGDEEYGRRARELAQAAKLIERANAAGYIDDGMLAEIQALGEKLTDEELACLSVRKGTLTDKERRVMESHVGMTRRMLSEMKFPKQYSKVPDWASSHHEFLNGSGYPDKLADGAIEAEARILTILDIYDALTARDRPYRPAAPAQKAFEILERMAADGQIDGCLLNLFKESEAWKDCEG